MSELQDMLDALAQREDVDPDDLAEVVELIEAGKLEEAQDKMAELLQ